ncbi:hypothetical protein F4809DRAFT_613920 [Biscogniauxia mediterranea]|nr:hypothetical protein F4809DRAFT_613920 [Biscogniauxia mediterranea]
MSFEESAAKLNGLSDGDPHVQYPLYPYLPSPKDDEPTDIKVEIPPLPPRSYPDEQDTQASASQTQETDTIQEDLFDENNSGEKRSDSPLLCTNSASSGDESKHTKPNDEQVVDGPGPSDAKERRKARKNAKKKEKKAAKRAAAQTEVQHGFVFDYHVEHDSESLTNLGGWHDRRQREEEAVRSIAKWAKERATLQEALQETRRTSTPRRVEPERTSSLERSAGEGLVLLSRGRQQSKELNGVESKTSDQENRNEERSDLPSEVQPQPPRSTDTIGDSAGEADGKTQVCKKAEESLPKAPSPPILETQQKMS